MSQAEGDVEQGGVTPFGEPCDFNAQTNILWRHNRVFEVRSMARSGLALPRPRGLAEVFS
jgi:hypothetical protein